MKKLIIVIMFCVFCSPAFAQFNPNSFTDEEEITVNGKRQIIDVEVSELTVTIELEDFEDGIATKEVQVDNVGNTPMYLNIELDNVPSDLEVEATVDDDFLTNGESTTLTITVEQTDMEDEEDFTFTVLVKASLMPF